MSTYGTALVIDSPNESGLSWLGIKLASERADVYQARAHDGWGRLAVAWEGTGHITAVDGFLGKLGTGRAAVAEDHDEFGALWSVLSADDGRVETVHHRYLLNANPEDEQEVAALIQAMSGRDPRVYDDAGDTAAAAAATLFNVDPASVVQAEHDSASAHLRMGEVGGPFPWWPALGLPWPGPAAGEPVMPDPARTTPVRMNHATWPRFARQHVFPHLESDRWEITGFGAIRHPSRWVAQGLHIAQSSHDWVYAMAFVLPLYVPTQHIHHMYALRLPDHQGQLAFDLPTRDTLEDTGQDLARAVNKQGVTHLDKVGSLDGFAQKLTNDQAEMRTEGRTAWGQAEPLAYTLLLLGRTSEAVDQLALAQQVAPDEPEWQQASGRRAALIAELLDKDHSAALEQLDSWSEESANEIGMSRNPPPHHGTPD